MVKQNIPEELKHIVAEAQAEKGPERAITARLRRGYSFRIGDEVVFGPRLVSVDRRTAILNLHKWDNTAEVRELCGLPPVPVRLTLEQEHAAMREDAARRTAAAQVQVNESMIERVVSTVIEKVLGPILERFTPTPMARAPKTR